MHALVAKAESLSSEALRTTQAESARAAQAEAVRSAQTEALVDSLLKFKQTQAAELAKRDAAIAELQRSVAKLHIQQQGGFERQEDAAKGQQGDFERPQAEPKGRSLAFTAPQDPVHSDEQLGAGPVGSQKAAVDAVKGSSGRNGKAGIGPLKGRTRQSIDGKTSRQGAKVAIKAKATSSRTTACLLQQSLSTPQGGLGTQTDRQQRQPLTELLENEVCMLTKCCLTMFCLVSSSKSSGFSLVQSVESSAFGLKIGHALWSSVCLQSASSHALATAGECFYSYL